MTGMWPYTHGILAAVGYTADAAAFDGVNDNLASTSALSTAADGKEGVLSFWFRINSTAGDGVTNAIMDSSANFFRVQKTTANVLNLANTNSTAGGVMYNYTSTGTFTSTDGWVHALIAWSETNGIEARFNGSTAKEGTRIASTRTADYTIGHWTFGAAVDATNRCYMDFFDVYFNVSTDGGGAGTILSKFYSGGKPVDLSTDGSTVTGTAPIMFLHLDDGGTVTDFATNVGSGSSFAITGTLVTSTSSPTD